MVSKNYIAFYYLFFYGSIFFANITGTLYEGSACTTSEGKPGTCTRLMQCNSIYKALMERKISPGAYVRCSFKGKEEVICCGDQVPTPAPTDHPEEPKKNGGILFPVEDPTNDILPSVTSSSGKDTTPTPSPFPRVGAKRKSELACERYFEGYVASLDFHILNGIPTYPGEFPHMVAMAHSTIGPGQVNFDCGASLVSENFVLTAAHCVNRPELKPTFLRLGKVSLRDAVDESIAVDVGVTEVILHPEYRSSRVYHDIALLKLNMTLDFTDNVRPVCLYSDKRPIEPTIPLTATGWGKISFQNRERSDVLLKVDLNAIDMAQCNATYLEGDVDRRIKDGVMEGQICAHDSKGDACQGDSGGPLQIVGDDKRSTLVGVISVGVGCGSSIPGLYTSVAHYLEWIESIVW